MKATDGSISVHEPLNASPPRSDRESSPEPCSGVSPMNSTLISETRALVTVPLVTPRLTNGINSSPQKHGEHLTDFMANSFTQVNGSGTKVNVLLDASMAAKVNGHVVNGHHDNKSDDKDSGNGPSSLSSGESCSGVSDAGSALEGLQTQLRSAQHELQLRDEEVARLSRIRTEVEAELEELTASLFTEAHSMVRTANMAQAQAERRLKESEMQVEVLQAEVVALKALVITSTPSRPNPHLHPQLQPEAEGKTLFARKHRRSPSHFNLKYGRENSPPDSPVREARAGSPAPSRDLQPTAPDDLEVDPVTHKEFVTWRACPRIDRNDPFLARAYREDIVPCIEFTNMELGARVIEAVEAGGIFIEAVTDKSRTAFPKKCALMEVPRVCHYRLRLPEQDCWYPISQICRNRITAVCDFLNYLRYIERGLVKSSVSEVYWEVMRLRKQMALARLGLPLAS